MSVTSNADLPTAAADLHLLALDVQSGTPAFIVVDKTAPGMLSLDEITTLVAEARADP